MAASGKRTVHSADEWLLNGSDGDDSGEPKGRDGGQAVGGDPVSSEEQKSQPSPFGAETAQWTVGSGAELNGGAVPAARARSHAEAAPGRPPDVDRRAPEPTGLEELRAENHDLAIRVRRLQTELRMREKEVAELAEKHHDRELRLTKAFERQKKELANRFDKQETELRAQIERLESEIAAAKPAKTRKSSRKNTMQSLNDATFEELRGLGLTVTQSARVIAYRDVRGGFESLDELAEIPGIPKETRTDLRNRLTVSN